MSEAIDAIRNHFNQAPIPKAKCLLDERDKVNAMIDAIEAENAKLMELCVQMVETVECSSSTRRCALFSECEAGEFEPCLYEQKLREMGIEVPE